MSATIAPCPRRTFCHSIRVGLSETVRPPYESRFGRAARRLLIVAIMVAVTSASSPGHFDAADREAAALLAPIPSASPQYPRLVRELPDAPPVLWVSGLAQILSEPAIAVVGARDCSLSAARLATSLARDLAATGLVVVSGLARGIDAAAHRGALEGGYTVAVLGSGADIVYPAEHRELAVQVRARGALVSEFPPGTRPRAWHFPRRNRIIAGLAVAVVVVEASETSGALITTREALDQGKEVMVVPGSVVAGRNRGGHALLKDGAALVENARDVLDVLRGSPLLAMAALRTESRGSPRNDRPLAVGTSLPDRWAVGEELDLDDLKELVSGHAPTLPRRLLEWELAGLIARTSLGRFVRLCR